MNEKFVFLPLQRDLFIMSTIHGKQQQCGKPTII